MSKVIVTGGCGFIGSNLVDMLVSKNYDVTVIDNLKRRTPTRMQHTYTKIIERF